ncbi:MAG: peptidase M3, partial [Planctomycetes bacterium]|nr:peptidase M3 [Planctomycetota bacterium]
MTFRFDQLETRPIPLDEVRAAYQRLGSDFDAAPDITARVDVIRRWDELRRRIDTWGSLAHIRFCQDTRDADRKRLREEFDETAPKLTELSLGFIRKVLDSAARPELEEELGHHLFAVWECSVLTYSPAIEKEKVDESKLEAEYEELLGSAEVEFRGETYNLSTLGKFFEAADRETRHEAQRVRWQWFQQNADKLDRIFDDLVRVRVGMAAKLGYDDFTGLGYRRMTRTDYGPEEVARYRDAVRQHVVPLCSRIVEKQATTLGLDKLMYWDEAVQDPRGNPRPQGGHDQLVEQAQQMFDAMGHGLDAFFRLMIDSRLTDLDGRKGKAVGGFCSELAEQRLPFIYANFNGTKGDVEVFTHEMGHAFQC